MTNAFLKLSATIYVLTFLFFASIVLGLGCDQSKNGLYALVFILGVAGGGAFLVASFAERHAVLAAVGGAGGVSLLLLLLGGPTNVFANLKDVAACRTVQTESWKIFMVGEKDNGQPDRQGIEKQKKDSNYQPEVWELPKYDGSSHLRSSIGREILAKREGNKISVVMVGPEEGVWGKSQFDVDNGRINNARIRATDPKHYYDENMRDNAENKSGNQKTGHAGADYYFDGELK